MDGLWSCCGDERIFVFTTNHVEKLDKALLRPGRMDMQIELSYCTFPAFRVLAQNYLSTQDHPLFAKLESAFLGKTMTPAQIAELLIKDKLNVDIALENVISALDNNVPESPSSVTTPDVDAKDEDSVKDGVDKLPSKQLVANKGNDLISTLQGVIKVLERNVESPSKNHYPDDVADQSGKLETFTSKGGALSGTQHSESDMKELVQSIRATLLKNKGDIDSAIEGVIQVLENKLPISEIQHHVSSSVDEPSNGTANGLSSQAASNGLGRSTQTERGEIK